jgi:hypothetical protein
LTAISTESPPMFGAALLKTIDEAGVAVLTLTEGLQDDELLGSRLTRSEVLRHLKLFTEAALSLSAEMRADMPEVDWAGLQSAATPLAGPAGPALDEALLMGAKALVPGVLMWLRVYKQQHPQWFSMLVA